MYFSKGKPIFAALALAVISACSSSPDRSVETIESRLSAAGFVIKLADTPEKLTHLESMAQRRLFPINRDGGMVFVYADSQGCKCIYVGSGANYQQYQRLAIQQNIVDEQQATAEDIKMAAQTNAEANWDVWGLWPRPVIY
ncbi:MAG: hypothetical protein KDI10_10420 [Halioglobus sp.]|nr:hypothetical protein [Halioglobus sp.]MCB1709127.1 hypothetical protein [Halioglobus sp.]MCP5123611.1 hypothetical protein [Pseudomonadales bacterium]MCP5193552.1 hypothetical protein [Pseudomonadales bacterium]